MAAKCENCKKGIIVGKQHTHHPGVAGGRWKKRAPQTRKVFKANLHHARILIGNVHKKMKLCTKCLRRLKAPIILQSQDKKVLEVSKATKTSSTQAPIAA